MAVKSTHYTFVRLSMVGGRPDWMGILLQGHSLDNVLSAEDFPGIINIHNTQQGDRSEEEQKEGDFSVPVKSNY